MRARINHVSVGARELGDSVRFYKELFGAEEIDTPNFGYPVQWLRLGDLQIHLFQRTAAAPTYHHFALEVDDFESAYRETRARGMHDRDTMGWHLNELPSGQVQLYIRDPGGNLVEINCRDTARLSDETRSDLTQLRNRFPQAPNNARAHLYLEWSSSDHSRPR
jgi:catechol 2,3-dioxygenase-like lactoylglutathione lyase family enzyme